MPAWQVLSGSTHQLADDKGMSFAHCLDRLARSLKKLRQLDANDPEMGNVVLQVCTECADVVFAARRENISDPERLKQARNLLKETLEILDEPADIGDNDELRKFRGQIQRRIDVLEARAEAKRLECAAH
jgi:hypothetical protein